MITFLLVNPTSTTEIPAQNISLGQNFSLSHNFLGGFLPSIPNLAPELIVCIRMIKNCDVN